MTVSSNGIPVTWPELIARNLDLTKYFVQLHQNRASELAELGSSPELAQSFGGPTLTMGQGVILLGPDFCDSALADWLAYLPNAIKCITDDLSSNTVTGYHLLTFLNIAQCSGCTLPKVTIDLEKTWLPLMAQQSDRLNRTEQQSLALLSVAAQLPSLVPQFLSSNCTDPFIPGKIFEFNVPGFIQYLDAAITQDATFDDVAPAWQNFLLAFPYILSALRVQWHDLLFVGKVLAQIQHSPVELVAKNIHQQIMDEFSEAES